MNAADLLNLMLHGNQLKRTARTGWAQRGIPAPESVAAHSFGVVYTTLLLAELVEPSIDRAAALAMAALHDLPEGLTSDIPAPAWRLLPSGAKQVAERRAMETITGQTAAGGMLLSWWEELLHNETPEARLVHDADKLDQYLQAYVYEQQTGNRQLEEFWAVPHVFTYPHAQTLYDELRRRRASGPPADEPPADKPPADKPPIPPES